jgi:Protein of unknown function (DUF3551)
MKSIRAVLVVLTLSSLTAIDARPTAGEIYRPWCTSDPRGTTNCGFTSFEQCQMTAGPGSGFYCEQNPWYLRYGAGGQRPDTTGRRERTRPY